MSRPSSDTAHDDIIYPKAVPFLLVHLACLAVLWTGTTPRAWVLCAGLYLLRMFAITAGFHRYFSHKTYKTSRVFQFVLAFVAQTSAQQGALWWAAKHRHHHAHSDTVDDVHSPRHHGFLYAHLGWIFTERHTGADLNLVKDLSRYPELVWLNRHHYVPPAILALLTLAIAGWPGLVVGFFISTVFVYHGTFAINSLAHGWGTQRYVTGDDSRNNWWLALITLGEGWHNNHHYHQSSTRQGFRWWEIDITYGALKVLSWMRVVRDLRTPPEDVIRGDRRLPRPVIEKVARQLAASFPVEQLSSRIRHSIGSTERLQELRSYLSSRQERLAAAFDELELPDLPDLPTVEELAEKARAMYARSPSLPDIAERARQLILDSLAADLLDGAAVAR